jgi:ATP adenylyltransferase
MDRLFTPWRFAYVTGQIKEERCLFCTRRERDDPDYFVLHRGQHWYIILNRYPYNNGHMLLVLNRHHPTLSDCEPSELGEMARLLRGMERTLHQAYAPDGINCGYNGGASAGAGVPEHFHWHMMPRWQGDTSFMTTVGRTRIMPEDLAETFARLKPILAEVLAQQE